MIFTNHMVHIIWFMDHMGRLRLLRRQVQSSIYRLKGHEEYVEKDM